MATNSSIVCRVVLPETGERCGYVPEGKDVKEKLANLFRHERDAHVEPVKFAALLPKDEQ